MPVDRVLAQMRSSRSGLGTADARRRRSTYGPNILPRRRQPNLIRLFVRQFRNPLAALLLASGLLGFALGRPIDGTLIVAVALLNGIIRGVQEQRTARAIEALDTLVPDFATVLRDGFVTSIDTAELALGDVVLLQSGDRVAADMRVLSVRTLQVNEAALTGESFPVAKQEGTVPENAFLAERASMLFAGTMVSSGTARAVVTAIGAHTELGAIAAPLLETREVDTPLMRQLGEFGTWLSQLVCALAFLVGRAALRRGFPVFDAVRSSVSIAVAAIPAGLPAILTVALAVAARRMAKRNAVARGLPAVETLGSTTIICSDKTGTLTLGEMTASILYTPSGVYELTGGGYTPVGELRRGGASLPEAPPDVVELLVAAVIGSDAELKSGTPPTPVGDPTEVALIVAAEKIALGTRIVRAHWRRIDAIPFEPAQRYMATLEESPDGEQKIVMKGAPEVVLPLCHGLDDPGRVLDTAAELAGRGMRVLAIASSRPEQPLSVLWPARLELLRLLGLVAIVDPPRREVIAAVARCRGAGIVLKMVTGDHPATAKAIGVQIGIADRASPVGIGAEMERLGPARLQETAEKTNIWARVEPEHKLRLVQALQARGAVVAMTGDGVNDAPALKQADVGVAMGSGTAAAKEAADVVLLDDNFASIAGAVEGGRRCYDNIVKATTFIVPTSMGQSFVVTLGVLLFPVVGGVPLMPIVPLQILWVNLVTGVTLAIPLAFEPAEGDVMRRPPRPRDRPIITGHLAVRCLIVAILMTGGTIGLFLYEYYASNPGAPPPELIVRRAQTMAATTLVFFQLFYLLQCRSLSKTVFEVNWRSNPVVYAALAVTLALQVAFVSWSPMNILFHTAPLDWRGWVISTVVAALLMLPVVALQRLGAGVERPRPRVSAAAESSTRPPSSLEPRAHTSFRKRRHRGLASL